MTQHVGPRTYHFDDPPEPGELARLVRDHGSQVVVGHPTYGNEGTIGALVASDICRAAQPNTRPTAVVVVDGTWQQENPDERVFRAAHDAARETLSGLPGKGVGNVVVITTPYDGYRGDRTPGKGSALKLLFDEFSQSGAETLILADGDLRNEMGPWRDVYETIEEDHRRNCGEQPFFITARYARHFVDASLTRFIVGPLTTLLGTYVPGGISGDIVLSAGAVNLEVAAPWTDARRRYGTDISTTLDNIASGSTVIYEAALGAKLHDITDEAKLSVMPGEVIGAALERLLAHEKAGGLVSRALQPDHELLHVIAYDEEATGIPFVDPGGTDVFDIDAKLDTLAGRFDDHRVALEQVLPAAVFAPLAKAAAALRAHPRRSHDDPPGLGMTSAAWCEALQYGVAHALRTEDPVPAKLSLNYLYTAAFLDFVTRRMAELGYRNMGTIRSAQQHLAVPASQAHTFYANRVEGFARELAGDFFGRRETLRRLLAEARP